MIVSFPFHFPQNDFKAHFKNISRIMDCVGCSKCRLWGKLQVRIIPGWGQSGLISLPTKSEYACATLTFCVLGANINLAFILCAHIFFMQLPVLDSTLFLKFWALPLHYCIYSEGFTSTVVSGWLSWLRDVHGVPASILSSQIQGIGTALKILFSGRKNGWSLRLTRREIIALFNVVGR